MSLFYDCTKPDDRADNMRTTADSVIRGELVVLPTDTVYGIGADAFIPSAVNALLDAKGRGRDMPVPVLVGSWKALDGLVLTHAPTLAWDLGDTRGTVAVRMPLHPVALELLKLTGPLAVSSANRSGQAAATTAAEAQEQL